MNLQLLQSVSPSLLPGGTGGDVVQRLRAMLESGSRASWEAVDRVMASIYDTKVRMTLRDRSFIT